MPNNRLQAMRKSRAPEPERYTKGENMNEQTIFWAMILTNVLFISGFLFQTYRTMKLKTPILGKNILMYVAIMFFSVFFNLAISDKIGNEKVELIIASLAGFVFGAFSNVFKEDKGKTERDDNTSPK
jgi:hypothetical protein